ncbi:NAD(P)H-binding protein [Limibacillus sp. MBR-115]|jgi:uncharacterized protein YbjT (DUF2867 family)|uniref:NAD(P)H-binding protein n=1 Tax=Limibacillus sp. MBR-115 TaxID=3156465 RepID=UPI003398A21C
MSTQPILVIGSTGKTGSRIVKRLRARGEAVREGSRQAKLPFDWDRPEGWRAAVAGTKAFYISYFPDLAFPGAAEKIEALTKIAAEAGVQRLVLLSGRGELHAQRCEAIVADSGVAYTLVRCAWFAQNFTEGYLLPHLLGGAIALPAGEMLEPIVDADDIADVAVAALTEEGHAGELYEVTGPRLLSFADAAAEVSSVLGRKIDYHSISLEAFHASMVAISGAFIADILTEICRQTLDGRNQFLGDGVQRALGREPRDFADFCRASAAEGFWKAAA